MRLYKEDCKKVRGHILDVQKEYDTVWCDDLQQKLWEMVYKGKDVESNYL